MKLFLKLGSLFALIIAGRYMQLTTPSATAGLTKSPVALAFPSSTFKDLPLTRYTTEQPISPTIIRVSQHPKKAEPITWF
ncbi:hypothetical protein [Hymenobacter psoromatis]|uniref:hypothetical protein n=1 Tax=Hymenobacter psoromatis TaxID=1484116 RepID=UPI001CC0FA30|nr:hypothetical protein [Hymenobacter psoromatis]